MSYARHTFFSIGHKIYKKNEIDLEEKKILLKAWYHCTLYLPRCMLTKLLENDVKNISLLDTV